jgi:glycosyltransferase involved in cell wall biosynthesis
MTSTRNAQPQMNRTASRGHSGPAAQPIELLHPRDLAFPSGGSVYNASLIEAARLRGLSWSSRTLHASEIEACLRGSTTSFRLCDSLFLDALAAVHPLNTGKWGLLLHYLPSTNPTLDRAERMRLGRVEARAIEASSGVIVTGRAHKAWIEQSHPHIPVFLCEPGVGESFLNPPKKRAGNDKDVLELLTVANLLPGKGMLELLAALARVAQVAWRWHVIGDRARDRVYTRRFDTTAQELGLAARIVQHGARGQTAIAELMDEMDLFVFASCYEAYGMALAEAAARCLPAVTTDVGAAAMLYEHGRTGLIAPPDDARSFSAHLETLMTDATLRQRFRDNLSLCTPRTWQDTLDDVITAIDSLA